MHANTALGNLYLRQVQKIRKSLSALHEDLQFDYSEDIQLLYLTRWDIEIGIREIKTVMDINVLRSKTPDMALKELCISLATYNLIRKIIYASIKSLPFFPKEDFIHKFYTFAQDIYNLKNKYIKSSNQIMQMISSDGIITTAVN